MELAEISEDDIEDIADSDAIIERGKRYYRTGRVKSLDVKGDKIIAKVIGNYGNYTVRISVDGDEIDGNCNCPYDGYGCKHIVAALYKWISSNLHSNYPSKKSYNHQEIIKNVIRRFGYIKFEDIAKLSTKEKLSAAFDILNKNSVKFIQVVRNYLLAEVKDIDMYKVRIQPTNLYRFKKRIFKECSCDEFSYNTCCQHILAVLLSILKNINPSAIPKDYEANIRKRINKERYNSFIGQIGAINANNANGNQKSSKHYKTLFNVEVKEGNICLSIEKAPMLNNGTLGKTTLMTIGFIKENYLDFSDKERKVIDLMFNALNKDSYSYSYYSNSSKAVKNTFSSELDSELLKHLRAIYSEEPLCFINCQMPKDKALVEVAIEEMPNNIKDYSLNVHVRFQNSESNLNEWTIFNIGNKSLWAYIKPNIVELDAADSVILRNVLNFSGIEISSRTLHNFIEKYYVKLSEITNVNLPKAYEINEIGGIIPKPRLYLRDYQESFCVELKFLYQAQEAECKNFHDIIFRGKNNQIIKIKRNNEEELKITSKLMENAVIKKDDIFLPVGDPLIWLSDTANNLISDGFEIYGKSELVNYKIKWEEPELSIGVSSGIDWLDLKADVNFGEEKLGFDKIVNALINHERFVKLSDGSLGMIPKKWLSRLGGVIGFLNRDKKNGTYRASHTQIEIIESLISIASKSKADSKYKQIVQKLKNFKEIKEIPLPKGLKGQLREYQKSGYYWLNFLKDFSFGGCLADEMGLGKTLQVLALLLHEKESGNGEPSLIIVPTSLVFNWIQEIEKFAPFLKVYTHHGPKRLKEINQILGNPHDLIITTYATLREDIEIFRNKEYHYIILDESQQIKNPLAKNTRSVYSLSSKHRLVMTGTPVENNYLELWSQFAFLNPGMLGNIEYFKKMFMVNSKGKEDKISALKNIINPFILMRKKEMVAKELPEKQITVLYCEMDERQRKIYDHWKERYRTEISQSIKERGFMKSKIKILQSLTILRQICNHPYLIDESFTGESGKFALVISQIEEIISEGHKVLVFSAFVKMLNIFKEHFIKNDIKFSYIYGETKDRKGEVEKFQDDSSVPVFLISLKAGGFGLNLTAADYVFIVDPWWNPAVEMQAIDRTHRIGQTKNVFVYKVITKDSIEEKILELQETKIELVKKVITAEEGIFKKLGQEDINYLFK